ncbi:MAG TPA: aldo/keto reductase [Bryobacteraceae bacterium]|jgi:aryl-alcohol dehydrogenase (NADP+)|nr:aldo/keto reductase [Bryobacteraceae bacterium]
MDYLTLGQTGLKVSRLCLGAMTYGSKQWRPWVLEEEESRPFLKRALELGINFIDTADMYSLGVSEEIVGRALRDFGPGRDRVVIATKVFQPMGDHPNLRGLSRKHIFHSIDDSLRRLGTDYVDIYQIHRFDYSTPIEETIGALDDVVRAGKVRYLGASAMFAWQFARMLYTADRLGRTRFVSMQNHYNVVYREEEREMLPLCRAEGIGVIPFSPLARGFVSAKRETVRAQTDELTKRYYSESDHGVVDAVTAVAQARGVSNAQVALAWLMHQPGVTAPIVGASKPHHLEEAVAAVSLKLDAAELKALAAPYRPHGILGHA